MVIKAIALAWLVLLIISFIVLSIIVNKKKREVNNSIVLELNNLKHELCYYINTPEYENRIKDRINYLQSVIESN